MTGYKGIYLQLPIITTSQYRLRTLTHLLMLHWFRQLLKSNFNQKIWTKKKLQKFLKLWLCIKSWIFRTTTITLRCWMSAAEWRDLTKRWVASPPSWIYSSKRVCPTEWHTQHTPTDHYTRVTLTQDSTEIVYFLIHNMQDL
jgi:hypothetical protein